MVSQEGHCQCQWVSNMGPLQPIKEDEVICEIRPPVFSLLAFLFSPITGLPAPASLPLPHFCFFFSYRWYLKWWLELSWVFNHFLGVSPIYAWCIHVNKLVFVFLLLIFYYNGYLLRTQKDWGDYFSFYIMTKIWASCFRPLVLNLQEIGITWWGGSIVLFFLKRIPSSLHPFLEQAHMQGDGQREKEKTSQADSQLSLSVSGDYDLGRNPESGT